LDTGPFENDDVQKTSSLLGLFPSMFCFQVMLFFFFGVEVVWTDVVGRWQMAVFSKLKKIASRQSRICGNYIVMVVCGWGSLFCHGNASRIMVDFLAG